MYSAGQMSVGVKVHYSLGRIHIFGGYIIFESNDRSLHSIKLYWAAIRNNNLEKNTNQ